MDGVEPQSARTLLAPSSPISKKQNKSPPPSSSPPPRQQPRRRRIRSELDRLLSDEGTRNMLRAIKKSGKTQKPTTAGVFRSRVVVDNNNKNINKKKKKQQPLKKKRPVIRGVVIRKQPKARERSASLASSAGSNGNNNTSANAKMSDVKVDLSVVSVSRRGNVGFVTVACGAGGGGDDEVEDEAGKETKRIRGVAGAFSVKVMQSVDASIRSFEQDSGVSVIVVQNSHSKYFCNGIDLQEVVSAATNGSGGGGGNNNNKQAFSTITKSIKSLISTLSSTRKVMVASVAGDCVGLGVMILPLFDFVYANDKSMFRVHYNALGQSPEGVGLLHNLMAGSGAGKISSLLYLNTPLTACEAQAAGLVSEILWPARYQEELLSRVQILALNSSLAMRTKAQVRNYKRAFRIADLSSELNGIEAQWGGDAFLEKAKAFIENGGVVEHRGNAKNIIKIGGGSSGSSDRKIMLLNGGASHVICNGGGGGGSNSSSCGG